MPVITFVAQRWVPTWNPSEDLFSFSVGLGVFVLGFLAIHACGLRFVTATATTAASAVAYAYNLAVEVRRAQVLAVTLLGSAMLVGGLVSYRAERSRRSIFVQQRQLAAERAKSEALLRNVLPTAIADRLKNDPSHIADGFSEVTILFADIVGFTDLSDRLSPAELVAMLNRLFTAFDDLADKHGLEKIKTIGDAYMVVGGLPEPRPDHAEAVVAMALGMRDVVAEVATETGYGLKVRIGASSGPVVAGVIGRKKFAYDLWGDAVNTASRMESHGLAGEIQITASTQERVKDAFELESRGMITVKGKGEMQAWLVRGVKSAVVSRASSAR